ncbi:MULTISPECIES: type II secretion system protein GspL [Deefgea]|uniref:GspL cytoplasmic actin-ATPase-like domain-containing protein n=1 Tax=Deefgea chitinilytica TaxID=570276 RepID=A0ABS2C7Q4_9NEIS|nr:MULTISPECIES: type II secretion system protein GspL [Deefgea]MBM5570185.1 hypothetical protein [Deefgea chitinilytica]MBM9887414.1 hypothetical protein [Deefgea sp. CFH1-16]
MDRLERLIIRMGAGEKLIHDWLGFDANATVVASGHDLRSLPAAISIDLTIPAVWLTSHRLNLPAVNKKQRELLISQALEDRVLGAFSDLHWVAGAAEDGATTVWLIEKTRLAAITEWVAQSGLQVERYLPEHYLLPHRLSYTQSSVGIVFCSEQESAWLDNEAELLALYPEQSFQCIAVSELALPKQNAVSFYQPAKVSLSSNWNDWRMAVYVLIGCAFIYLLSLLIQWRSLAQQELALRQEIRQTFASIFPGVPVVDPILQWQSLQNAANRGGSNASGDALDLLYKTAGQIDLDLGIDSVEVKAGKVSMLLDEDKAAALLAKLTAQGAKVQRNAMPDGRVTIEVQP